MSQAGLIEKKRNSTRKDDIEEAVSRSFDRTFSRRGVNKKSVASTFEAALEGLRKAKNPESRLRSIAKSAALSTGRSHGNVVETGRILLDSLEELSAKHGFKPEVARDQILLGIAEGACQIGPVVYCRFLEVANSYKEEADDWICRNRRLPALVDSCELPVIVPYEESLTIESKPPVVDVPVKPKSSAQIDPSDFNLEKNWSRPPKRGFFKRLRDFFR